jgi:endogenous inhibitor of DNA gyrase (YacG/DUF329 family)
MSLIKCPECGNKISEHAESCPSCGRPMRMSRKGNAFDPFHDPIHFLGLLIAIGFVIAMICAAVIHM